MGFWHSRQLETMSECCTCIVLLCLPGKSYTLTFIRRLNKWWRNYQIGWRVELTLQNPGAPDQLRTWRADLFGFDPSGVCVLMDVSVTCLTGDSAMRSRGMDMRGRVEALLRDAEMRKMRNPRTSRQLGRAILFLSPLFCPRVVPLVRA